MSYIEDEDIVKRVLLVDDEELNLDILQEYLECEGYEIETTTDGKQAVEFLEQDNNFSAIILDRMMPVMDGIEFIKHADAAGLITGIPIIMQTAAASPAQIRQGIEAGVFYYLTKPYDRSTLLAVLNSALEHSYKQKKVVHEFDSQKRALGLLKNGLFTFRNLEEAQNLSLLVAGFCPNPDKAIFGLNELTVNAIEHGNLGINYEEKKVLLERSQWEAEIKKRISLPENKDKYATLSFEDMGEKVEIVISDSGEGFDYERYIKIDAARMTDPNGRGIAITKMYAFNDMKYVGCGNKVVFTIPKAEQA